MMGRGADGGCGTEERPCPISRAPSSSSFPFSVPRPRCSAVPLLAQARKALSDRSPFVSEEEAARVPTLPVSLAASLARHGDGRRRPPKKPLAGDLGKNSNPPATTIAPGIWDETEEYFRALTLPDLDLLAPRKLDILDSSLRIPAAPWKNIPEPEVEPTDHELRETGVEQEQEDMEIDEAENAPPTGTINISFADEAVAAVEEETDSSLNWLLGCKNRAVLTTERPNKKRRLLGSDAGLRRVLTLPGEEESMPMCHYCCNQVVSGGQVDLLHCKSCHGTVHGKCYGVTKSSGGVWLCSRCKYLEEIGKDSSEDGESPCWLCPRKGGALKPVQEDGSYNKGKVRFVHLFCSLWMPELYVERIEVMEPIMNIEGIPDKRRKLVCSICKVKHGACVRCSHGACRTPFHPLCARVAKQKIEIWGKVGCDNVELRAFCIKHSDTKETFLNQNSNTTSDITASLWDGNSSTRSWADCLLEANVSSLPRDKSVCPWKDTDPCIGKTSGIEEQLKDNMVGIDSRHSSLEVCQDENMEAGNLVYDQGSSSLSKFLPILRKLTENGKVNIHDVASETGILSSILDSAMQGDSSILSSEMQLKLLKWVQSSFCVAASSINAKTSIDAVFIGSKEAGDYITDAVEDSDAIILDDTNTVDVIVKSLPPRRRTTGNIASFNKNEVTNSPTSECALEPIRKKRRSESTEISRSCDNGAEEALAFQSSIDEDYSKKNETEWLGGCNFPNSGPSCNDHQHKKENTSGNIASGALDQGVHADESGSIPKIVMQIHQSDPWINKLVNQEYLDASVACDVQHHKDSNSVSSYVHPWINKRLIEMVGCVQNNLSIQLHDNRKHLSKLEGGLIVQDSNNKAISETDILFRATDLGTIQLSPEDELEGELIFLQNKLISASAALESHYENLIFNVVSGIPAELDALKNQRWDTILVNQYLREVREAKKRGRKERRLREAKAILAAATASAASSRVQSLRKDGNNEFEATHEEHKPKLGSTSTISESNLQQWRKEKPSKLVIPKLSSGKQSDVNGLCCDICRRPETLMKPIFVCGQCKVAVHLGCYRRGKDPISSWYCEPCELLHSDSSGDVRLSSEYRENMVSVPVCNFCGTNTGAFRKSTDGKWVHAFCAEWILGSKFRRGQEHLVEGVDAVIKTKEMETCSICRQNVGVCLKCCYGHCQTSFHPICARDAGLFLNLKTISGNIQRKVYCEKHSQEQREKAEFHHGAEEIKNLRQTRVELEKLRLLCERIIKREKLKRELLVCSHDILSAKRTYVANTVFARRPFLSSGLSSESATTSINNTSYSGTVERSDDVTVDSSLSRKRRAIPPLHIRLDRTGEASTRSNQPSIRVVNDRTSFSGKQLPQRPASYGKTSSEGKRPSKTGKHREVLQKELLMTSDQTSFQNPRLHTGFVHVTFESTSKSQDVSCEPPQPDG